MADLAPSPEELIDEGRRLLSAGLKPLPWHPEWRKQAWCKIPDHGRDELKGYSFGAAVTAEEWQEMVARHVAEHDGSGGVGVLLGQPSSALVLEADPRNGGAESFTRLAHDAGWDPSAAISAREHVSWRSGRGDGGGGFLFARHPDEARLLKALVARYPGIDVLDEGRFQVVPPSLHPDSMQRYSWRVWPGPELRPQLPPPGLIALAKSLTDEAAGHWQAASGAAELPASIGQGERDNLLTSFAGSMRKRGASEEEIFQMLGVMNARCAPQHGVDDLRRIARSVARYAPGADPALDEKLLQWAAGQAQKAEPAGSLIPSLGELVASPEGVQALKRRALDERAQMEIRAAKAAASFIVPPPGETLDFALAKPRPEVVWRLPGIWPRNHRIALAALFKTGKSLLAANAVASLAAGIPVLGGDQHVTPCKVTWWNLEMDEDNANDYLAVTPAKARKNVMTHHLRAHPVPFLTSAPARDWALQALKGSDVWVIDTWTRLCAVNGVNVSDNYEVTQLAAAVDELMAEAGVTELLILSHMPKSARAEPSAETALGAQALSGWVDTLWLYWADDAGQRFLRAEGRGVQLDEFRVDRTDGNRLAAQEGGRHAQATDAARLRVLDAMRASLLAGEKQAWTGSSLAARCKINKQQALAAVKDLLHSGELVNVGNSTKPDLRLAGPASMPGG